MKMKKVAAVVMAAVMSLTMATAVNAEQVEPQAENVLEEIQLRFSYIERLYYALTLGSTYATIAVSYTHLDITKKV